MREKLSPFFISNPWRHKQQNNWTDQLQFPEKLRYTGLYCLYMNSIYNILASPRVQQPFSFVSQLWSIPIGKYNRFRC